MRSARICPRIGRQVGGLIGPLLAAMGVQPAPGFDPAAVSQLRTAKRRLRIVMRRWGLNSRF